MSRRSPRSASRTQLQQKAQRIATALEQRYGHAECALHHNSPFQLLAATILSAQCTDERVNSVTPTLFANYPDAFTLAEATQPQVETIIQSLGFFRAKATHLRGMAQALVNDHHGEVPRTLPELIALPGVGRKTANVVLGTAFGIPSGVVVDTHVRRITGLLGLTRNIDPVKIETDLQTLLPASEWINFSHRLIHHGRQICIARRPRCTECPLLSDCARTGLPPLAPQ